MKKVFALALAALMTLTLLAGCSGQPAESQQTPQPELDTIVQKVKDAYGENYLPGMPIDEQTMADMYSIDMDNVEEFFGEMPMMSAHVDTFIAIKAKEGKGDQVEEDVTAYHQYVLDNAMQYPSNIAKVQASQVVRHGDYVFYVLLGAYNDNLDATEAQQAEFAKAETQKAIDAIDSCFEA